MKKPVLAKRYIVDENSKLVVLKGRRSISGGLSFKDDAGNFYILHDDQSVDRVNIEEHDITGRFQSYETLETLNATLPKGHQQLRETLTVWVAEIPTNTFTSPPTMLEIISEEEPTFEQIKNIFGGTGRSALHRTREEGYHFLRSVKSRQVVVL